MRSTKCLVTVIVTALVILLAPAGAEAGKKFEFGFVGDEFSDNLLTSPDASTRAKWMGRAKDAGASYVRINTYWGQIAPNQPLLPRNPADPLYRWGETDARVASARAQGLKPILTILSAPRWADSNGRPSGARPGTWMPDVDAFGDFAAALAKRYSGKVFFYEAWNEPNLDNYLTPQWNGKQSASPDHYRRMLNTFYEGVKSVSTKAKVITAGTSPVGSGPGGKIMRPIYFWREVMCLNKKLKKKCNNVAKFDIFGHNAINYPKDPPTKGGPHPDDATPADFGDLRKLLRKAEAQGLAKGPKKHQMWSTESWYESRPPERRAFNLAGQAAAMQKAMYILWKQGASNVIWLQVRDSPYDPKSPALIGYQSGIYFLDERPKPSLKALQFPFVADRKSKKKVILWGIAPKKGKVKVKAKGEGKVAKIKAKPGKVFKTKIRFKGKGKFQAKLKGKKSLNSKVRK